MKITRASLVAVLAALPCLVLAAGSLWSTLDARRGGGLWPPDSVSLPEAVAARNTGEVMRLIALGHDPNRRATVRPVLGLSNSDDVEITALEAAVWVRDAALVRLLADAGALLDEDTVERLRCLNDAHQDTAVREVLAAAASNPWPDCRTVTLPK